MPIRLVKHEVEARLSTRAGRRCGKSEYKVYGNGERQLRIVARRLPVAEGALAAVLIAGRECARLKIAKGGFVHDARSSFAGGLIEPHAGERIEIRIDGVEAASGVYELD